MKNLATTNQFNGGYSRALGESGTSQVMKQKNKLPKRVSGNGMKIIDKQTLLDLSKKKLVTQSVVPKLVDMARAKGAFERMKSYWNAYHCLNTVYKAAGSLYIDEDKYCKNRICAVCCGIRKAELINKYLPELLSWWDTHFLTLTVKAVPADQLKKLIDEMVKAFSGIIAKYRKRHQRGRGIKLMGIKSIESNFNPKAQTYNPHLHILIPSKQMADILKKEWLLYWGILTDPQAQRYRPVKDTEKSLSEVIKYSTKIFTRFDPNDKKKPIAENTILIYAAAIDNIVAALKPHRVFDRFGFNLPPTKKAKGNYTKLSVYQELHFDIKKTDWINVDTAEPLSGYTPPQELTSLLGYNIDTYLQ